MLDPFRVVGNPNLEGITPVCAKLLIIYHRCNYLLLAPLATICPATGTVGSIIYHILSNLSPPMGTFRVLHHANDQSLDISIVTACAKMYKQKKNVPECDIAHSTPIVPPN